MPLQLLRARDQDYYLLVVPMGQCAQLQQSVLEQISAAAVVRCGGALKPRRGVVGLCRHAQSIACSWGCHPKFFLPCRRGSATGAIDEADRLSATDVPSTKADCFVTKQQSVGQLCLDDQR